MKTVLSRLLQVAFIFIFSGTAYVLLEMLCRGYSHITMWVLGGICGVIIALVNNDIFLSSKTPFEIQVAFCATCCVLGEYIFGIIFNRDFTIWDYREIPGTFADGQLNIFFILLWIVICIFAIPLLDWIEYKLLDGRRPVYRFLCLKRKGEQQL